MKKENPVLWAQPTQFFQIGRKFSFQFAKIM